MDAARRDRDDIYEIEVQGELDPNWQQWFNGLEVTLKSGSGKTPTTKLRGPVPDQAALRGLLCRLWDLNLTVVSFLRIERGNSDD
jgi:hypothetical protein